MSTTQKFFFVLFVVLAVNLFSQSVSAADCTTDKINKFHASCDYQAVWVSQTKPEGYTSDSFIERDEYFQLVRGEKKLIQVNIKNIGKNSISQNDFSFSTYKDTKAIETGHLSAPLHTHYDDSLSSNFGKSFFASSQWKLLPYQAATLQEKNLLPGQIGEVDIPIFVPKDAPLGCYREDFSASLTNNEIGDAWIFNPTNGDARFNVLHIWIGICVGEKTSSLQKKVRVDVDKPDVQYKQFSSIAVEVPRIYEIYKNNILVMWKNSYFPNEISLQPGDYTVQVKDTPLTPNEYIISCPDVNFSLGDSNMTIAFQGCLLPKIESMPTTPIEGFVYYDKNDNGRKDKNEILVVSDTKFCQYKDQCVSEVPIDIILNCPSLVKINYYAFEPYRIGYGLPIASVDATGHFNAVIPIVSSCIVTTRARMGSHRGSAFLGFLGDGRSPIFLQTNKSVHTELGMNITKW